MRKRLLLFQLLFLLLTISAKSQQDPNYAISLPGGVNGAVSSIRIPALNITSLPITIEAWFKPEGTQNDYAAIWQTRSGTTLTGIFIRPNSDPNVPNQLRSIWNGQESLTLTPHSVALNKWHHAAMVITTTSRTLYLDGVPFNYPGSSYPLEPFDGPSHIGWDDLSGNNPQILNRTFKGLIDEVRFWKTAKTAQELQNSKYASLTGNEAGLVGYWRFDDNDQTRATDYSANGFHGTINGGTYTSSSVFAPMSYLRSDGMQPSALVNSGSKENPVFRLEIETDNQVEPLILSAISLQATGTTVLADISNVHLYYTGANPQFSGEVKIGSLGASPAAESFSFTSDQKLAYGKNYVWVVYDVATQAANGNFLDAAITGFTLTGASAQNYVPATTAPEGGLMVNSNVFINNEKLPFDVVTRNAATPVKGANFASFQQDAITTYNGYQYVAYWNNQFRVCIARKKLPLGQWEEIVFNDHTVTAARVADDHYSISIGICENDGTIHIAFDMHDDNLRYRKSVPNLANTPDQLPWTAASFGAKQDHLVPGSTLTLVTYPRFVSKPDGNLLFETRLGGSGGGDSYLWEYAGSTGNWTYIGEYIDGRSLSPTQNAYINGIHYDPNGRLHVSWVWRETPDPQTNHDVYYGYSDDHGRTWKNAAGVTVAQATANPMTLTTPGLLVKSIGKNRGLINQESQAVDSKGKIHILQSYMLASEPTSTNFWTGRDKAYLHHIYQDENGVWQSDNTGVVSRNRSEIAVDENDNLYVVAPNYRVYFAAASEKWKTWTALDLSGSSNAINEGLIDRNSLLKESVLSFVFANSNGEIRVPYYVIEKSKPGTGAGVQIVTYSDTKHTSPVVQRLGAANVAGNNAVSGDSLGMSFEGFVETKYAEAYTLYLTTSGKTKVWINDAVALATGNVSGVTEFSIPLSSIPSHKYKIRIEGAYAKQSVLTKLEWASARQARELVPLTSQYGTLRSGLVTNSPLELEKKPLQAFTYPNPFSDFTTVEVPGKFEYSIIDVSGRVLEKGQGMHVKNIGGNLIRGLYLLKIEQGQTSRAIRLLKL